MSEFTKDAQWIISAEKVWSSSFCDWPDCICISRSFPFRRKHFGRRLFKWFTQRDLLMFAHVLCMAFARLFNAEKKHVLNHFALEMAAIVVARRRHRRNQRLHGRRERISRIILPDKFTRLSAFIYRPVYHMHLQEHHLCLFATMR